MPPCGRFGANAAWYRLSLLAYYIPSAMKSLALELPDVNYMHPSSMSAARPKRLLFSLFGIAGRIVSHAGRLVLRIGAEAERVAGLLEARLRLAATFAAARAATA